MSSSSSKKAAEYGEGSRSEVSEETEEPMMNGLPGRYKDPFMLREMENLWNMMNRGVTGSDLNSYRT